VDGDGVSEGLVGFVCEGITFVPVGTDVRGGVGLPVDDTGSELDQLLGSGSKSMHDPMLGPRGVGVYRRWGWS
jgi:hypothetical protein